MKLNDIYEGWLRNGDMYTAELSDIEAQMGGRQHPRCPKCRRPVEVLRQLHGNVDREGEITHWSGGCPYCRTHLTVFNDHEEKTGDVIEEAPGQQNRQECPDCDGKGKIHKSGVGGSPNPRGYVYTCDTCDGLGWINKKPVTEGKTRKNTPKKPRAKHLADIMKGRKGGAMRDEKKDYVRAKEKQKIQKEIKEY